MNRLLTQKTLQALLEAQSRHVATKADLKELEIKVLGQMVAMGEDLNRKMVAMNEQMAAMSANLIEKMNAVSVAMKDLQIRILATLTPTIVAALTAFAVVSELLD